MIHMIHPPQRRNGLLYPLFLLGRQPPALLAILREVAPKIDAVSRGSGIVISGQVGSIV
jgi:hypothetical protein